VGGHGGVEVGKVGSGLGYRQGGALHRRCALESAGRGRVGYWRGEE
jgi:hypothetical protein